jgi:hypothetical protein
MTDAYEVFGREDRMTFGKHKGALIADVAINHYPYLLWANTFVEFFHLTNEQVSYCVQRQQRDKARGAENLRISRRNGGGHRSSMDVNYDDPLYSDYSL